MIRVRGSGLFRSVTTLVAGAGASQLLILAAMPMLTRLYDPSEVGTWALYLSLVLSIGSIVGLRFDLGMFASEDKDEQAALFRASLLGMTAICAGMGLPLIGVAVWLPGALGLGAMGWSLMAVNIWLAALFQLLQYTLNRDQDFFLMSRLRVEQALVTVAVQLALGSAGSQELGLIVGTALGHLVPLLRCWRLVANGFRELQMGSALKTARAHWRMPVMNGSAAALDALRLNGVNVLIGQLHSAQWLGFYSLAWRISVAPSSLLSSVLGQAFLPRFASTSGPERSRQVRLCMALGLAVGVPMFATVWLWGEPIFRLLFGEAWGTAGRIAENLAPYLLMSFVTAPLASLFVITGRQFISLAFSFAYVMLPFLVFTRIDDLLLATSVLGWSMFGLLTIYLAVAVRVGALESRGRQERPLVRQTDRTKPMR